MRSSSFVCATKRPRAWRRFSRAPPDGRTGLGTAGGPRIVLAPNAICFRFELANFNVASHLFHSPRSPCPIPRAAAGACELLLPIKCLSHAVQVLRQMRKPQLSRLSKSMFADNRNKMFTERCMRFAKLRTCSCPRLRPQVLRPGAAFQAAVSKRARECC